MCSYIDNVLFITKHEFVEKLNALEKVLHKWVEVVLEVDAVKSLFERTETEYLGLWV